MQLVVDANVLFAALIKDSITRRVLLVSIHDLYLPEFSVIEFKNHLPELSEKTGLAQEELALLFERLIEKAGIKLVPFEDFKSKKNQAQQIAPDKDDVAYLALALHLHCGLWSNDKALKSQKTVEVFSTAEILNK
ncbi:MAG: hypothetical protein JW772_03225 [Candidatus Diapherotrites archaeon]|nr:hypothetical protein [Candidatus Diapherotrites archaeon]